MTKRMLFGLIAGVLIALGVPASASAHVLKVDGDIGAVLHINPDDNPTTGSPTDYILSFDDDTGKFSLPECTCSVAIIENGTTITTKPLVVSGGAVSENRYTFAKPGVYTMRFTGSPKTAGAFQSFTLDYEVRVTGGQANMQPVPVLLWVGMGMAVGLVLLAAYAMDYDTKETEERN